MRQNRLPLRHRSVVVILALLAASACTDFSSAPPSLGRVQVKVQATDQSGISQIPVDLLLPNKITVWRAALTTTDGSAEFAEAEGGVIPQQYVVRILLAGKGYELAADEINDKPVTVQIGATQIVTFRLRRTGATPPPSG
ncbi:MAG TPA: hypothetical protein VM939_14600 [Gemmatimonadaceae bacterium]|nr:hypothetical protein [Gemmatimonadaceae bacterium]